MLSEHNQDFETFKKIHDGYLNDSEMWSDAFHTQGRDILDIIRTYERRLCAKMERGSKGQYSNTLAEKFWSLVKQELPLIDHVGVKSSTAKKII